MPRPSQDRQLSADRAVADDAQLLAADLEGVVCALEPAATVAGGALLGDAAQQQDRFGQHQFGDRARVGVRCVEDRDAAFAGRVEVDLVGADAEAAHGHQFLRVVEDLCRQLSTGADAEEVHIGDARLELGVRQGAGQVLDAGVARGLEHLDRRRMDAFEQEELDLAFVEGGLAPSA